MDESKDVLYVLEKVGHEVGEEGFYTFSVAKEEDLDGGETGDLPNMQLILRLNAESYRCHRLYLFPRFHARVPILVRKRRCPSAPQKYRKRLINSRPWVVMQRYERSHQGPRDKDWRGIERIELLGKMNLESVPWPNSPNGKPPFIEALTE